MPPCCQTKSGKLIPCFSSECFNFSKFGTDNSFRFPCSGWRFRKIDVCGIPAIYSDRCSWSYLRIALWNFAGSARLLASRLKFAEKSIVVGDQPLVHFLRLVMGLLKGFEMVLIAFCNNTAIKVNDYP